jgi:hypothetical protein
MWNVMNHSHKTAISHFCKNKLGKNKYEIEHGCKLASIVEFYEYKVSSEMPKPKIQISEIPMISL